MSVTRLHLIPDASNITESMKLCEKYNACFEYNDFYLPSLLDDKDELDSLIKLYKGLDRDKSNDTLHGVFYDICINSSDSKIRQISTQRARSSMQIADELGCKGVIFHTNTIPGFDVPFYIDGWLDAHEEFYNALSKEYPNIEIYVENMFDYRPDMLYKLARRMENNHSFGVCFDVSHAHVHDVPIIEWMKQLAPYIKHLHVNDNDGTADNHDAVGDGNICWEEYFSALDTFNINASMLIEVKSFDKQIRSLDYLYGKGLLNGKD